MLQRLSQAFPAFQELIFISAWLMGFILMGIGLRRLLPNAPSSVRRGPGPALLCLFSGSLLLALPTSMASLTQSLFADADPRRILSAVSGHLDPHRVMLQVGIDFMSLMGWIAGGRGLYLLAQAERGSVARGLMHLMGGVCLVNLLPLSRAIGMQIGIDAPLARILADA